jgi:hypothetical protein
MLAAFKRIMSLTDTKTAWIQVACYFFGYGCFCKTGGEHNSSLDIAAFAGIPENRVGVLSRNTNYQQINRVFDIAKGRVAFQSHNLFMGRMDRENLSLVSLLDHGFDNLMGSLAWIGGSADNSHRFGVKKISQIMQT